MNRDDLMVAAISVVKASSEEQATMAFSAIQRALVASGATIPNAVMAALGCCAIQLAEQLSITNDEANQVLAQILTMRNAAVLS